MRKQKDIYKELSKTYTDEEIVEGFVFNVQLPKEEQKAAHAEFLKLRLERLKNRTPQQILSSRLMRMKILMQDYFKTSAYDSSFAFSKQLAAYIELTGQNKKDFAADLDIHPTKLSRMLNDSENPNVELMYRLEKHSNEELPAFYWWRLHSRKLEHLIKTDLEKRLEEGGKVKNVLPLRA